MSKTYKERLIAGLVSLGWQLDKNDRSRYQAYIKDGQKLFVGNNGALRTGECASHSYSVGDATRHTGLYLTLLKAGDDALNPKRMTAEF